MKILPILIKLNNCFKSSKATFPMDYLSSSTNAFKIPLFLKLLLHFVVKLISRYSEIPISIWWLKMLCHLNVCVMKHEHAKSNCWENVSNSLKNLENLLNSILDKNNSLSTFTDYLFKSFILCHVLLKPIKEWKKALTKLLLE